jgi:hypothetical protein
MTDSDASWEAIRRSEKKNAATRKRLAAKAGLDDGKPTWCPKEWESRLDPWEFNFMVSDSFDALCNQGGLIHAFHCFFDTLPSSSAFIEESKVLDSWEALQSLELPKLYMLARDELKNFGRERFEDLEPEEEEELEKILDDAWIGGGVSIEIRLAEYANTNNGEQDAANGP